MVPSRRQVVSLVFLALFALAPLAASGDESPPASTASPAPAGPPPREEGVPIALGAREVFEMRAPVAGYSVDERARLARARLLFLASSGIWEPVAVRSAPEGRVVEVAGRSAFYVLPGDLDPASDETLEARAARAALDLTGALAESREAQSLPALLRSLAWAVAGTIVFGAILWLLERLRRRLAGRLAHLASRASEAAAGRFLRADRLQSRFLLVLRIALALLAIVFGYGWLTFVLSRFPQTRAFAEGMGHLVVGTLRGVGSKALAALPGLITVAVIVAVTQVLVRLVRRLFEAIERGEVTLTWLHPDTVAPSRRLAVAFLWIAACVMAYPYIPGSGSDAFKGASVLLGLMISLGSTSLVGQAMSGLVIMYARALKKGDYVRIGEVEGIVTGLGILSTKIRTIEREEVTIPNAVVVGGTTMNFSRLTFGEGFLLHTRVTIGYDTPWRQVKAMLLQAAERTPGLKSSPAPFVHQIALDDFYVTYQLNARIEDPRERIPVLSELHANIQDAFNEHGVQIMSPHFVGDSAAPKVVPKSRWHQPPATGS